MFEEIGKLKAEARQAGKDIIDFGMGNPDGPTPGPIEEKLRETVLKPSTHRYSQSKGIPRLRKSIADWYKRRFDVILDPETEAIVTMGSKEGLGHLALATLDKGDAVLVPIYNGSINDNINSRTHASLYFYYHRSLWSVQDFGLDLDRL